jgi:hypothetical protein
MDMKIKPMASLVLLCFFAFTTQARTLHIGSGHAWTSPSSIQGNVVAGDTVLIHAGSYTGTFFITGLNGSAASPILIKAAPGETVTFSGGTESFHFSDIAYVILEDLIIQGQTGNGMNIDDAGSFGTPSHHLIIRNCIFRNINASGNNDLLKLSGVDDFEVRDCDFINGSAGGSGIDMVGCHRGLFQGLQFDQMGSNCIQIKGGSSDLTIRRNLFLNGGARALNIGGSTDLEFFRPQNATFEAARAEVYANVFEGAQTPFAFVGAVDCEVYNNTIFRPTRWALRILQETVDPGRFEACGRNTVQNNIFVITTVVTTEVNIGPDTAPNTFIFANNLWYKEGQSGWAGPVLPVVDPAQVVADPQVNATNYMIGSASPAYQKGKVVSPPVIDYYGKNFKSPPSIGAVEFEGTLALKPQAKERKQGQAVRVKLSPNPAVSHLRVEAPEAAIYGIVDAYGRSRMQGVLQKGENRIGIHHLGAGAYYLIIQFRHYNMSRRWVKI